MPQPDKRFNFDQGNLIKACLMPCRQSLTSKGLAEMIHGLGEIAKVKDNVLYMALCQQTWRVR